jgi:hypothetical protein
MVTLVGIDAMPQMSGRFDLVTLHNRLRIAVRRLRVSWWSVVTFDRNPSGTYTLPSKVRAPALTAHSSVVVPSLVT